MQDVEQPIIQCRDLTVKYGNFFALDGFSVDIKPGCTGLLGPNGAGKTTFLKTLLGFVTPASGRVSVLGHDAGKPNRQMRQVVGLMPEQECHIPGIPAVQFVAFTGELAGMPANEALRRAHEVIEYCGLGEARYRPVETYSTGMKQRVKLAQALVHGPKVLLLDEPTNGLDPHGRESMLKLVRDISASRLVHVILCSHLLKDIERTCDQVVMIQRGKLVADGLIADLVRLDGQPIDIELREAVPAFNEAIERAGGTILSHESYHLRVTLPVPPERIATTLYAIAAETGAEIRLFAIARKSLEDAFLEAVH